MNVDKTPFIITQEGNMPLAKEFIARLHRSSADPIPVTIQGKPAFRSHHTHTHTQMAQKQIITLARSLADQFTEEEHKIDGSKFLNIDAKERDTLDKMKTPVERHAFLMSTIIQNAFSQHKKQHSTQSLFAKGMLKVQNYCRAIFEQVQEKEQIRVFKKPRLELQGVPAKTKAPETEQQLSTSTTQEKFSEKSTKTAQPPTISPRELRLYEEEEEKKQPVIARSTTIVPPSQQQKTLGQTITSVILSVVNFILPVTCNNAKPSPIPTVKDLVTNYTNLVNKRGGTRCTQAQFQATCQEYNKVFSNTVTRKYNEKSDFGYIEKLDLPQQSKLFVRADLHADARSLLENLEVCKSEGLLDANYKVTPNSHLVFLGDYADRGNYNLETLQLLMSLKAENPEGIHLMRGNHENLGINATYGNEDENFAHLRATEENRKMLEEFYKSLSLAIYISQGDPKEKEKQYIQYSHGAMEPTVDLAPLLDAEVASTSITIPKKRELSERMKNLKTYKGTEAKYNKELALARAYKYRNQNSVGPHVNSQTSPPKTTSKELKQLFAARKIQEFVGKWREFLGTPQFSFDDELNAYNWGDIGNQSAIGLLGARQWRISPEDAKSYFRIASVFNHVKLLYHGHQHELGVLKADGKYLGETLTVGMDVSTYADRFHQPDIAYIFTTAPKAKNWKKKEMRRWTEEPTRPDKPELKINDHPVYTMMFDLREAHKKEAQDGKDKTAQK